MTQYEKLDAMILRAIGDTPMKFVTINTYEVREESERLALEHRQAGRGCGDGWRIVDLRLQALRKGGKIRSTSTGWVRA
ncbi:hypothetical protein [Burkholderia cepacia]|uniref:hypothetical protein n=1 Tax=Burkholderia cepacia TaxID=292 RepID=UPI002ABDB6D3|nr:hypothetical protein [Burkholderia cepacia]